MYFKQMMYIINQYQKVFCHTFFKDLINNLSKMDGLLIKRDRSSSASKIHNYNNNRVNYYIKS